MEDAITNAIRQIIRDEIKSAVDEAINQAIQQRRIPAATTQTHYLKGDTKGVETLFSVKSVAEILSVSRDWVYKRIDRGEIASVVDLGGGRSKIRIPASELARFVMSRTR